MVAPDSRKPQERAQEPPGRVRRLVRSAARISVPLGALIATYVASTTVLSAASVPDLPAAAVTAALLLAVYALVARRFEKRMAVEIGSRGAARELLGGLVVGAGLCTATIGILAVLGVYHVDGVNSLGVLWPALAMAVLAGVFEELLVRGVLFRALDRSQGTWVALAVSAVVFGALHLTNTGATVLTAAAIALQAGVLLGVAYIATGRLWFPIGLHVAWNATQGGVFGSPTSGIPVDGLLQSHLTGPALVSGGGFGVEGSVITVLTCLAAAAFLLRTARRDRKIMPRPRRHEGRARYGQAPDVRSHRCPGVETGVGVPVEHREPPVTKPGLGYRLGAPQQSRGL